MIIDDFFWRALLAGVGVALIAGPLGCFIVWRRLAYFGDTLAHSALLGIALGFLFHFQWQVQLPLNILLTFSTLGVCFFIALLLALLQRQKRLATDTLLGILAHGSLSFGLVALAFLQGQGLRIDLHAYLFGDLLAVTSTDLAWIYGGGFFILFALMSLWQSLLSMTVHEELAQVEGVPIVWVQSSLMLMIALVIAVVMKMVGILLITALLIIPPATARYFARSPEQMAVLGSVIGCLAIGMGLMMSWFWDTPTSPSIVLSATFLFILVFLVEVIKNLS